MRVCPKCGYVDNPLWRPSMKFAMDFMRYEDFKSEYPHLAEKVIHRKFLVDEPFVYHVTRGGNVERMALIDNPFYEKVWGIPMEKSKFNRSPRSDYNRAMKRNKLQTKLLEVEK
jgi:hypothetical protein